MLKTIGAGAARVLPDLLRDVIALGAAASIAYGAWQVYAPAGFIVGGIIVLSGLYLQTVGTKSATGG